METFNNFYSSFYDFRHYDRNLRQHDNGHFEKNSYKGIVIKKGKKTYQIKARQGRLPIKNGYIH